MYTAEITYWRIPTLMFNQSPRRKQHCYLTRLRIGKMMNKQFIVLHRWMVHMEIHEVCRIAQDWLPQLSLSLPWKLLSQQTILSSDWINVTLWEVMWPTGSHQNKQINKIERSFFYLAPSQEVMRIHPQNLTRCNLRNWWT